MNEVKLAVGFLLCMSFIGYFIDIFIAAVPVPSFGEGWKKHKKDMGLM